MSGRIGCCAFTTGCNEQINAIAKIQGENRNVLVGTVVDECGSVVVDAVVVLLKGNACSAPEPITFTITDKYGQFVFGPLCPDTTYMLKIYKDDVNLENKKLNCTCFVGGCLGKDSDKDKCGCRNNYGRK